MIRIEAPDGAIVEFPDGTDDTTIESAMKQAYPAPQAQPQQQTAPLTAADATQPEQPDQRWGWQKSLDNAGLQTMKDFSTGVMKGNIPFADEITAGAMTPLGMVKGLVTGEDAGKGFMQRAGDQYNSALAFNRKTDQEAYDRSPVANTLGQVAGAVNTAGNLAKSGYTLLNPANPTVGNMALRGAAESGIYGATYGFSEGEGVEDRIKKGLLSGSLGLVTGAATGAIAGKLAQNAAQKTIPTADNLKTQAQAAYKAAEDAGVVFQPQKYADAVDDIFSKSANRGLDPTLTPNSVAAFKRLEELKGMPLTLQTLEQQRKILNNAAKLASSSQNGADEAIANSAIRRLDAFVDDGSNVLFSGTSPDAATKALRDARALWRKSAKSEQIAELLSRADIRAGQYSQSGQENALRTEFRQLAMNEKKLRGFTEAERGAIKKVATGGVGENALRLAGKFAIRGPVSGGIVAGTAALNPAAAAALAVAGEVAKRGAGRMTANNAKLVDALVRSGGQMPKGQITPAQRIILETLMTAQPAIVNRQQVPVR